MWGSVLGLLRGQQTKAYYHCKFFHREEEEGADTAGASQVSLVWELGSPEPVEGSVWGARGSGCGWQRGIAVFSTWNLNFEESLVASGAKSVSQSGPTVTGLNGALVQELQIHLKFWGKWTVKCLKTVLHVAFRWC